MTVRMAAVLGSPIEHSKSPLLHQAAYKELGLDWEYEKFEVKAAELKPFLDRLDSTWAGLSLTMPLKEEALRLATDVSEMAQRTGGANTLVSTGGEWIAHNTDVAGMIFAIEQGRRGQGVDLGEPVQSATVLGTGATARSAIAALAAMSPQVKLQVAGRTLANVEQIVGWAKNDLGVEVTGVALQDSRQVALDSQIVVSTIPANGVEDLAAHVSESPKVLVDVVYDPPTNQLAKAWVEHGGARVGGLTMLVAQAAEQVRLMTGYEGPLEPIREAMFTALADSGIAVDDIR
ncbi:MAG: shikimate dehydrogenase [Candidatus Nanopelagicales bacterium]